MIRTVIVTSMLLASPPLAASDSGNYARMGQATWSAFECSSLASVLDKQDEQKRLFKFGYDQGKNFISAFQAGRITRDDLNSKTPSGVLFLLEGPSTDFILGRIFESAQDNALKDVFVVGDDLLTDEQQKLSASRKFSSGNCQLIGNGR